MLTQSRIIFPAAAVMVAACLVTATVRAADEPAAQPRHVILCPECGMVYNIRRIDKPIAPERELLPSIASSQQEGTMSGSAQPVPLFSIGPSGPRRVPRAPTTRSVWEVTVRYDNGQFGFVTQEAEPEIKVGDRVRLVENVLELIPQHPR